MTRTTLLVVYYLMVASSGIAECYDIIASIFWSHTGTSLTQVLHICAEIRSS